jgi:outer membrane lipoprotein-sorting protein
MNSLTIALATILSAVTGFDRAATTPFATSDRLVMLEAEKAQKESPAKTDSPKQKEDARLKEIMADWQKRADAVRDIRFRFKAIIEDKTFGTTEVQTGDAAGSKPDLVRINARNDKGAAKFTLFFSPAGVDLYVYEKQQVLALAPPPPPGHRRRFSELGLLERIGYIFAWPSLVGYFFERPYLVDALYRYKPYVLGLDPKATVVRYRVELLKEDAYYVYLGLRPRNEAENDDFEWMGLALDKKRFVARLIDVHAINGNRFEYHLDDVETNVNPPISAESLQKGLPQGWTRSERMTWKLENGEWKLSPKSP